MGVEPPPPPPQAASARARASPANPAMRRRLLPNRFICIPIPRGLNNPRMVACARGRTVSCSNGFDAAAAQRSPAGHGRPKLSAAAHVDTRGEAAARQQNVLLFGVALGIRERL